MTKHEEVLIERIRALHARIAHLCLEKGKGIDTMRMVQIYAGMVCELLLEYDLPGDMMGEFVARLGHSLMLEGQTIEIEEMAFPPAHVLDRETEFGRSFAREITFDDWDDVHFALHEMERLVAHDMYLWEAHGLPRYESYALFYEVLRHALAFEFAAQDLCDVMIEERIAGPERWNLCDCICALSALAGWHSRNLNRQDHIDDLTFIMVQEATRLGVPGGKDWRSGVAANDVPVDPPLDLISSAEKLCLDYIAFTGIDYTPMTTGMMAKACGRMMALACGGDFPEVEPAIAKPLAMMALIESYKYQERRKAL